MSMFLLIYLVLCICAALVGRDTLLGSIGTFVVSLIFTPILVLLALVLFGPRHPRYPRYPRYERHARDDRYPEDDRTRG
jgi:hypothetical protein